MLSIWKQFEQISSDKGQKTAIVDAHTETSISYNQLRRTALDIASILESYSEQHVVLIGEPSCDQTAIILACALTNKTFIPLSNDINLSRLETILSNLPGPSLVAGKSALLSLEKPIYLNKNMGDESLNWYTYNGKTKENHISKHPFIVTYTSGSTGEPKAIAFSQNIKIKRTFQTIQLFSINSHDKILSASPLYHSLGQRHLFCSLLTGSTLIKVTPFNPGKWLFTINKYRPSFAIPVSTHLKILEKEILSKPNILESFRSIISSSAPADKEFKRKILDNAKFDFWEIYGMTETACATAVKYSPNSDTNHLGRPLDGVKVRIQPIGDGDIGEIAIQSDYLCDGYYNNNQLWKASFTKDGWFKSGDLGYFDAQGNLIFCGRFDDSFQAKGITIYPKEIEDTFHEMSEINQCIVFGIPNSIFTNLIGLAYTTDSTSQIRNEVVAYGRSKLPQNLWPAKVFQLDVFPTLGSGKVDRNSLIAQLT